MINSSNEVVIVMKYLQLWLRSEVLKGKKKHKWKKNRHLLHFFYQNVDLMILSYLRIRALFNTFKYQEESYPNILARDWNNNARI